MELCWISLHVVLLSIMCSFTANVRASPCAEVHSPSTMVLIGSSVKASCHIKDDCPLTKSQDFSVAWPYKANLRYSNMDSQDKRVSEILISNFTNVTVMLECAICIHEDCRVVAGLEIKSASPPPSPHNLTCELNLTEPFSWLCTWDPGQGISRILTNYTLHTEIRDPSQKFVYVPAPGKLFYRVPRVGFTLFSEVKVQVVAVNVLGQATSEPLVLDPMETAKLDAPEVQSVGAEKNGCLAHKWSLSAPQKWLTKTLNMEIRLKPMNDKALDKEQVTFRKVKSGGTVRVCGLHHGMLYQSKMRVRYRSSPWSEWSHPAEATTLIMAPTGRLVTWLKLLEHPTNKYSKAELFWKPSSQFHANSMNVSYFVSATKPPSKRRPMCVTKQQHCSLKIPMGARKIYLTATNLAGKSNPTEVAVYRQTEQDHVPYLKVVPESEESVFIEWSSPVFSAVSAYVLEWKSEAATSFEAVDKNQSSAVISGLEPYKPYTISVYPKYKHAIGQPYTIVAYTKQKAPSESPKLIFGDIRPSYVVLFWDEIPLQQRNGIITNYSLFYWDDKNKNDTKVIDINGTETHFVLKDLHPSTIYNIFFMTSTIGGSFNGSIVTVKTPSIDAFEIVLIVIPACVGLVLLLFGVFTCVSNHECWKTCLWPVIPDAANSSIKKWTADLLDMPPFNEVKDPVPVYLSHFSLLSLSEKELWKEHTSTSEYPHCGKWPYDDKSVNEDHSNSNRDSGIYNSGSQSESVPYATVVFANPYRTQSAPPPAYLRSESTQPLLGEEEPSSPPPCEKMSTQVKRTTEDLGIEGITGSLWQDFPMLKSLEIKSIHDHA